MAKKLSQDEIDKLVYIFGNAGSENSKADKDFALRLLLEKLDYYENKKKTLLDTIEREYDPYIKSLKKAIDVLSQ